MQRARRIILLVILVSGMTVAPLWAADPITGTWKLDLRASRFLIDDAPKEQTETYKELPSGEIELTLTRVAKNGTQSTVRLTWPAAGGAVRDPAGALGKDQSAVEILLGPGDWLVTFLDSGRQSSTMRKVISPDGRTMPQTVRSVDGHGRTLTQIQVLKRQ